MRRLAVDLLAVAGGLALAWLIWEWARASSERWAENVRYERENPYR